MKGKRAKGTPTVDPEQLMSGLRGGRIEPVRVGGGYRLGLLAAAGTMLILPLLYLGIIALVALGVYWYAVHAAGIFEGIGTRGRGSGRAGIVIVIIYIAPIIAGGILVLFMIKPLFARKVRTHFPLSLSRADEPVLFEFVARLCQVVGSPMPMRIDVDTAVNASASFVEGIGGFLKKDLVLTIGLPLVAGMNLRQLTGVLAHEFGHFAQGTAMRLSFIVRSLNNWFGRLVYERDEWDEWLAVNSRSGHWAAILILGLARICIWLSRRVLWVLMIIGHGVSCLMLRQMEFDADRYETRVAGSDVFVQSCQKLGLLSVASSAALNELEMAWRERRLADDLPSLIRSREREMPAEVRKAVLEAACGGKTGWFDTHPAPAERIASAKGEQTPGLFTIEVPASALFRNFRDLSVRATVAFYHQVLSGVVQRDHLVPTESLDETRGKQRENFESLRRYFQDLLHPVRPVFPQRGAPIKNKDDAAAVEMLMALRTKLTDSADAARAAAKEFEKADERLFAVARAKALRLAGQAVRPKELNFTKGDELETHGVAAVSKQRKAEAQRTLTAVLDEACMRLSLALAIEERQRKAAKPQAAVDEKDDWGDDLAAEPAAGSGDRLLDALYALKSASGSVETLRQSMAALSALLPRISEHNPESLVTETLAASRKTCEELNRIHQLLRGTPYPYEHNEKKNVSIAFYAVPAIPDFQAVGDVYQAADSTLDGIYALYMRLMADLAKRAESVEESLGLPPLPEPKEAIEP